MSLGLSQMARAADYPTELWKSDEEGWIVKTAPCDSGLCGYLVGYRMVHPHDPGYIPLDEHNPDPARRAAPICGLMLMGGFKPSKHSKGVWDGGWVYNPDNGKTYSGTITEIDADTVKLRGYIGLSLFGRTLILHRLDTAPPSCTPLPSAHAD
jgi:uncharacterized protein (DUF2147 family)